MKQRRSPHFETPLAKVRGLSPESRSRLESELRIRSVEALLSSAATEGELRALARFLQVDIEEVRRVLAEARASVSPEFLDRLKQPPFLRGQGVRFTP